MNKKDYSRSQKSLIRFFCILGIVVEVLCVIRLFLRSDYNLGIPKINTIADFFNSDLINDHDLSEIININYIPKIIVRCLKQILYLKNNTNFPVPPL